MCRFVGTWSTLSKLVCIAVMIRGRHRGLPVAVSHILIFTEEALLMKRLIEPSCVSYIVLWQGGRS